jgi:predicted GNAT family N-acyltransferase
VRGITLLIEPLSRAHSRKLFDCGENDVTRFLREKALQEQERDLSRTLVLVDSSVQIIGYHTLIMSQVKQEEIPQGKPLIKRAIPVILLGQISIDTTFQGQGYGDLLLTDAQARVHEISNKIGIRALMLDARSEHLAQWYESRDFIRFPKSLRMFKSIQAIRQLQLISE